MSQHMDALRLANEVRLAIADVKHDIAAGRITVAQALDDPRTAPAKVYDLIASRPRWARRRTLNALRDAGIHNELKRVRELTDRQREALIDVLENRQRKAAA